MIFIYTTFPSQELARKISAHLVKEKLIACANLFPSVNSIYSWKSKVEESQECVGIFKTKKELFETVKKEILSYHEYECPCIVSFSVDKVHKEFLDWIHQNIKN